LLLDSTLQRKLSARKEFLNEIIIISMQKENYQKEEEEEVVELPRRRHSK